MSSVPRESSSASPTVPHDELDDEERRRPDSPSKTANLVPFLALLATSIVMWSGVLTAADHRASAAFASVGTGLLIWSAAVLVSGRQKAWGLVEVRLGPCVLFFAGVTFGFATLTILGDESGRFNAVSIDQLPEDLALAAIAYAAFAAGYVLYRRRVVATHASSKSKTIWPKSGRLFLLWSIGISSLIISVAVSGRLGYLGDEVATSAADLGWYSQPLSALSSLRFLALGVASYWTFKTREKTASKFLVLFASVEVFVATFTGMKESFVMVALAVTIPYIRAKGKIPIVAVVAMVTVFFLVVSPFVNAVRESVRDSSSTQTLSEASRSVLLILRDGEDTRETTPLEVATRFSLIGNINVIRQLTPEVYPYKPASEIVVSPFLSLVPRAVWPDKPVDISGLEFYRNYWGGTAESSSAVTVPGSLLLYGPPSLLIVAMAGLGLSVRRFDEWCQVSNPILAITATLIVFNVVLKQEANVTSLLRTLPVWLLTYLISRAILLNGSERSVRTC